MGKISLFLSIILYLLLYWVRLQQGGFEVQVNLFRDLRTVLDQRIATLLPSPQAELLSGILLGQNNTLPGQFKLALRDTSTLHIVVASGQNLSMVAGFFLLMSGLIKRKVAIILGLGAIIFFTVLTGAQVPILRAAIMVFLASIAKIMGREGDGIWVLLVTALGMLLINPSWITDLSFQLSVLATIGVVVVAPIIFEKVKSLPLLGSDLAVSLGAQLMVMPIIAQNFHQFSLVALPTNLLVLWTVPFIMILGALLLVVSFIPPLAWLVAMAVNVLLTYFIYIVQFFASVPWSWIYIGEQIWLVWLGYYLIVLAVLLILRKHKV